MPAAIPKPRTFTLACYCLSHPEDKDKNRPARGRTTPASQRRKSRTALLDFDSSAGFDKFLFDGLGFVLRHAFLDGLGRGFHQILGFLQTEAGDFANGLDDADLVSTGSSQDNREFRLGFSR